MATQKFQIAGVGGQQGFALYGEKANLEFFFGAMTAVAVGGPVDKQVTVKAHQRELYPGAVTKVNVPSTSREYTVEPTRRSGTGLPGRSIRVVGDRGLPGEENRAFTLDGDWNEFCAWARGKALMALRLYNNTGAWVECDAKGGTP
jgi:hypothetical protein